MAQLLKRLSSPTAELEGDGTLVLKFDLNFGQEDLIPQIRASGPVTGEQLVPEAPAAPEQIGETVSKVVGQIKKRTAVPVTQVVHILHGGKSLCGREDQPRDWPEGHSWVDFVAWANNALDQDRKKRADASMCGPCKAMGQQATQRFVCAGAGDPAEYRGPAMQAIGKTTCKVCGQIADLDQTASSPTAGFHIKVPQIIGTGKQA